MEGSRSRISPTAALRSTSSAVGIFSTLSIVLLVLLTEQPAVAVGAVTFPRCLRRLASHTNPPHTAVNVLHLVPHFRESLRCCFGEDPNSRSLDFPNSDGKHDSNSLSGRSLLYVKADDLPPPGMRFIVKTSHRGMSAIHEISTAILGCTADNVSLQRAPYSPTALGPLGSGGKPQSGPPDSAQQRHTGTTGTSDTGGNDTGGNDTGGNDGTDNTSPILSFPSTLWMRAIDVLWPQSYYTRSFHTALYSPSLDLEILPCQRLRQKHVIGTTTRHSDNKTPLKHEHASGSTFSQETVDVMPSSGPWHPPFCSPTPETNPRFATTATGGTDTSGTDTGGTDTGGTDTSGTDTGGTDTSGTDTGGDEHYFVVEVKVEFMPTRHRGLAAPLGRDPLAAPADCCDSLRPFAKLYDVNVELIVFDGFAGLPHLLWYIVGAFVVALVLGHLLSKLFLQSLLAGWVSACTDLKKFD